MTRILYFLKIIWYSFTKNKNKTLNLRSEYLRKNGAHVGANTRIFSEVGRSEPYLIFIGDGVVISTNVQLITHDNAIGMYLGDKATDIFGKITIGDNTFIGANSIILPGVELGPNTIVGAGSIVTKSYKNGNVVIGGNPAKVICSTKEYILKNKESAMNIAGLTMKEKRNKILNKESYKIIEKN